MITSIVFSKDRALQLDLALKSIKTNFRQSGSIVVLYNCSDDPHKRSYGVLSKEHPDVEFVRQSARFPEWELSGIFADIEKIIALSADEYICFFTDDDIVYQSVQFAESALMALFQRQASCLSLRLGTNTDMRDYGDGVLKKDFVPHCSWEDPFLIWNRTSIPIGGYWSYPLSVDGHVFRKDTMRVFAKELNILDGSGQFDWGQTPNVFEVKLQRFWFELPPLMGSLKESHVVNSPNNRVQETFENSHGREYSYDQDFLKDKFNEGKRIDLDKINFGKIVCPHQEIDILGGLS